MVLVHTELMVLQEEQTVLKARTKLDRERKEGEHEAVLEHRAGAPSSGKGL